MQHVYIASTGQRIPLKVLRKSKGLVEYVEDTGATQISGSEWSLAVMDEIAATGSNPRSALEAVLNSYSQKYPSGFERLPLTGPDLQAVLVYFEELRQQARVDDDEEDFWFRCREYNEKRVLQDLETTRAL